MLKDVTNETEVVRNSLNLHCGMRISLGRGKQVVGYFEYLGNNIFKAKMLNHHSIIASEISRNNRMIANDGGWIRIMREVPDPPAPKIEEFTPTDGIQFERREYRVGQKVLVTPAPHHCFGADSEIGIITSLRKENGGICVTVQRRGISQYGYGLAQYIHPVDCIPLREREDI